MREHKLLFAVSLMVLAASIMLALVLGRYRVEPAVLAEMLRFVTGRGEIDPALSGSFQVLWSVRLPRVVAALIVGAALSVAGAVFQSLFRNPLVSPGILGVTSGAGFGATLALFLAGSSALAIEASAFAGGLVAVCLAYQIGRRGGNSVTSLVLAGVIVSAMFTAGISFLKYRADPYQQLPAMVFWAMGSFNTVVWSDSARAWAIIAPGLLFLHLFRWRLNPLALGDEEALSLGIDVRKARVIYILAGTLIVAASVASCGNIGWVGLVVPHMARFMVGPDNEALIPFTAILGGTFMLLMDTLARSLPGGELPVGVLTALTGAPFFAWLLVNGAKRQGWKN